MSASREKKKRLNQEQKPAPEQKKAKKLGDGLILAISMILILAIVFGSVLIYKSYWRNATVLTVGDHEISVKEFNYFYRGAINEVVNTYGSYISLFGLDASIPLDEQETTDEEGNKITWAASFADSAKTAAISYYAVYDKAQAAGFTLPEEATSSIDQEIAMVESYASMYNMDADDYVEGLFGKGCTLEGYRAYLELANTYGYYAESLSYTEEELTARYNENAKEFGAASYLLYQISAADFAKKLADGTTEEITDEHRAKAKAAADLMTDHFHDVHEKVSEYTEYTYEEVVSTIGETAADWLFERAQAGEINQFNEEDYYFVVKVISKTENDYDTVNALQLFIPKDEEGAELEEGESSAEDILAEVRSKLTADPTPETLDTLLAAYGGDESANIENGYHRTFTNEEAYEWLFNGKPTVNEYREFATEDGTYIIMFTGYGKNYQDLLVTTALTEEWLTATVDAQTYEYDQDAALHADMVDLVVGEAYNLSGTNSILG